MCVTKSSAGEEGGVQGRRGQTAFLSSRLGKDEPKQGGAERRIGQSNHVSSRVTRRFTQMSCHKAITRKKRPVIMTWVGGTPTHPSPRSLLAECLRPRTYRLFSRLLFPRKPHLFSCRICSHGTRKAVCMMMGRAQVTSARLAFNQTKRYTSST